MKSERRHALKENTLVHGMENAPAFFQQHGSRILLGLVLCLLTYILVRSHFTGKSDRAERASKDLGNALYALSELRSVPLGASPEAIALRRKDDTHDIEEGVRDLLDKTEDPKMRAAALLARGDMNWYLANFPTLPGSTTRPELNVDKSAEDLLKTAENSYNEVLKSPQSDDHDSVITAKFCLADISENRGDWDKARQYYQQVIDDNAAGKAFKELATERRDGTKKLEKPPYIGAFAKPEKFEMPSDPLGPSLPSNLTNIPGLPSAPSFTTPPTTLPTTLPSSLGPVGVPPSAIVSTTRPTTLLVPPTAPSTAK